MAPPETRTRAGTTSEAKKRAVLIRRKAKKPEEISVPKPSSRRATPAGTVRTGSGYVWRSRAAVFGIPLICVARGRDIRGKRLVAKGILAIGRYAVGGIAIGQFGVGVIAVGWFALGFFAFGQVALGALLGAGQLTGSLFAFGQAVFGLYGFGQIGWAKYLWTQTHTDMEAVSMLYTVKMIVMQEGGITLGEVVRGGSDWVSKWAKDLF